MTKARANLTELEGAILGVIRRAPGRTAYQVRRAFLTSRSAEWSGSAGAVYPAIRRVKEAGFIRSGAEKDARGTQAYTVTKTGTVIHDEWLCDVARAVGPGMDPFRTRACLWPALAPARRRALLATLKREIAHQHGELARTRPLLDESDTISLDLHLLLLRLRLDWIEREMG